MKGILRRLIVLETEQRRTEIEGDVPGLRTNIIEEDVF